MNSMPVVKGISRLLLIAVIGLGCHTNLSGQSLIRLTGKSMIELRQAADIMPAPALLRPKFHTITPSLGTDAPKPILQQQLLQTGSAPKAYRYQDLAFFCKLEVQLEKKASFPIKFRLGDVQYVDRLEGKYQPLNEIE
jgi:hypothetical protein